MKLVIQRVKEAKVVVESKVVGAIGKGLVALLGIGLEDEEKAISSIVNKMIHLRIFSDEMGKMNRSLQDIQGEILVVSQFTLYANCQKGMRPSFVSAAPSQQAIPLYELFVEKLKIELGESRVKTGKFGAEMQVHLINDGPVTILL